MRLTILSDTHVPNRAKDLPAPLWQAIDSADVVIHGGDWMALWLLDAIQARAARLVGVYGNNDGPSIRSRLPEVARVNLGGVRIVVVHETGARAGRELRAEIAYPETDLLIFGHSHIPWDSTTSRGLRLLNPGSATDRRKEPTCTYLTAEINDCQVRDVSLHHL